MDIRGQEALLKRAADYAIHQSMKSCFRQVTSIQPRTQTSTVVKVLSRITEGDILRFIALSAGCGLGLGILW